MPVTQHSFSKFSSPYLSKCRTNSGWTCRPLAKARPHFKMRSANFLGIAHLSSGESFTGGSFFSVWAFSRISSQEPTRRSWVVSSNRYSSDKVGSLTRDKNLERCAFLSSSWCLMYRKTACNTTFSLSSARGITSSVTTQSSSSASRSDKKLKRRHKNSSSLQTFEKCRRQCCLATLTSSSNVYKSAKRQILRQVLSSMPPFRKSPQDFLTNSTPK